MNKINEEPGAGGAASDRSKVDKDLLEEMQKLRD